MNFYNLSIDNKSSSWAQMMLLGPQINYMPSKGNVIVLSLRLYHCFQEMEEMLVAWRFVQDKYWGERNWRLAEGLVQQLPEMEQGELVRASLNKCEFIPRSDWLSYSLLKGAPFWPGKKCLWGWYRSLIYQFKFSAISQLSDKILVIFHLSRLISLDPVLCYQVILLAPFLSWQFILLAPVLSYQFILLAPVFSYQFI